MRILGLDFETTGLDPVEDYITEVGAVLWDTDRKAPLLIDSYFVKHDGIDLTEEITQITGIHQSDLEEFGVESKDGLHRLSELIHKSEAIVAHNGELFDRKFYSSWCNKITGKDPSDNIWIDTQFDVEYPEEIGTRKLTYLAAEHGFLNPFAHRAIFDVLTMLRVLDKYDINEVIECAKQPTIMVQAMVDYNNKDLAKERSFRWDGPNKRWIRSYKKHKYEKETFPFKTRVVTV